MTEMVMALYKGILEQVVALEAHKKEISADILLTRDNKKRSELVRAFLGFDLEKHELLEEAAVVALNNREDAILEHLERLYAHTRTEGAALDRIRSEIGYARQFIRAMDKYRSLPYNMNFTERRMVQEIIKYVVEQARLYVK